jgi:hypothetical protein
MLMKLSRVALSVILSVPITAAVGADILIAVMEDENGEQNIHHQAIDADDCAALLETFQEQSAAGRGITLTFRDPDFTGLLIEPYCLHEDGTTTGPDGIQVKIE